MASEQTKYTEEDDDRPRPPGLWRRRLGGLVLLVVIAWALVRSLFFVDETEYTLVTQFGDPVQFRAHAGLGFKWPFQSVWRFDRRLQVYSPPPREMLTEDKENLNVEWYACWRLPGRDVAEAELRRVGGETFNPDEEQIDRELERYVRQFLQSVGTVDTAQRRLEERLQAMIAAELGHVRMDQLVSLDPGHLKLAEMLERVTRGVQAAAADEYGIEVVDVRIKRFNYPESVKPAVFAEIRSERQRVADQYRAEGKSQATKIRSLAELHRDQILSQAKREAARVRGEGEARAIETANAAHRQDPAFYELLKTLDTYRAMLDGQTTVILSADSPLLKLLTEGVPPAAASTPAEPSDTEKAARVPAAPAGASNLPGTSTVGR
ncbi:MAG TPA: protease modulator HflC [Pirellulales bacterium]|jgi:membrane protease subunit HflC|nr:protease modulator HflC [Pirellulales bacterium]